MKELAFLVVGWLLGMAQSLLIERWQERRRRDRFVSGLHIELCRLQTTMAILFWNLKDRDGTVTRDDVEWVLSRTRRGAADDDEGAGAFRANFEKARQFTDTDFAALRKFSSHRRGGLAVSLRTYDLPLLESQLAELGGLTDVKAVSEVLNVRAQLSMYNETVMESRDYLDKTYDQSVTGENRQKVMAMIEDRYQRVIDRAKWIADSIERCVVALGRP